MTGRRRGRTGRGWDASPPRQRRTDGTGAGASVTAGGASGTAERAPGAAGGASATAGGMSPDGARRSTAARAVGRRAGDPHDAERPVDRAEVAERAREICLRQLAVRPRTRAELAAALRRRGIPDDVAGEVLQRYGEVGIVDDRAFASAWVASRHHGRGLARRALAVELRRKGVEDPLVGEALGELDPETEERTARALVERRLRTDRGGPPDAVIRRLVGMLARKGYPPGLAFRVVKEVLADLREAELETDLAEAYDVDALEAEVRYDDSAADGPL